MKTFFAFILLVILSLNSFSQYHWKRHPDNPIMTGIPGEWDQDIGPCTVLFYDDTYHLWYIGYNNSKQSCGYATSPDGITWTRYANNPVMLPGTEGEWDSQYITDCHVVKLDTIFHMWYTGSAPNNTVFRIGHATSLNGLTWTKDPDNPIEEFIEGDPENTFTFESPVVFDGNMFHLYYATGIWHSSKMKVNHAMSEDGYNWTLDPNNPIVQAGDNEEYTDPEEIVYNGDHYIMSYLKGYQLEWDFNLALSDDLYSWEIYDNNPVFTPGPSGSWEAYIGRATILYDSVENKYRMWYMGGDPQEGNEKIGYAESSPFVEIPDTAFLYALIDKGVDTDGDSLIHYKEAEEITYLDVSEKNISDMTGIEAFFNLDTLYCAQNQLTSLDVSGNRALKILNCDSNQLNSLDISNNTELGYLHISDMPALYDVCIWDWPFPPAGVEIDTTGSPNVYFTLDCWDKPPIVYDTIFYLEENSPKNTTVGFVRATDPENNLLDFAIIDGNINETFSIYNSGLIRVANVDSLDYESMPQFVLTVVVTEREGPFSDTAIVTINLNDVVDIRAHESMNKLTIHPNPASSSIKIETCISYLHNIEITSLNGKLIFSKEMAGSVCQIDLSSFRKGVYFITIRSKDFVITKKIIKL
jgi:predicted GH43/DUF377 family glycosyl hydrolase